MILFGLNTPELTEVAILLTGGIVWAGGVIQLSRRNLWNSALALTPMKPLPFMVADIGMAICLFLLMGQFLFSLHALLTGRQPPASQPASYEGSELEIQLSMAVTVASQVINIVLVALIVGARLMGDFAAWGLQFKRLGLRLLQAILIYLAIWPVCAGLLHLSTWLISQWGGELEIREHAAILLLQSGNGPAWLILATIVSAVVLAPILEEFVFRGLVFRFLSQSLPSTWSAVAVSAVLFGLIHFTVPQTILSLVFFGMVLAFSYAKTGSLTLVILIHLVFNLKTIILLFLGAKN